MPARLYRDHGLRCYGGVNPNVPPSQDPWTKRPLEYVAFWQALGFVLLICVIWTAHVLNLSSAVYQISATEAGWYQSWLLTAAVIVIGFVTVAHTYLQERRILRGLIIVCSYCHKVQIDRAAWQQMELFVSDRTLAEFTHGVCPSCYERVTHKMDHPGAGTAG